MVFFHSWSSCAGGSTGGPAAGSSSGRHLRAYPDNLWGIIIIRSSCADFLDFIRSSIHGQPAHPRGVAYLRRPVGSHRRPLAPTQEHPPLRRRTAAHLRPGLSGGHPVRPAHRLSVEGSERNEILPRLHGPRPLPGVGAGRRLPDALGARPDGLRRLEGDRLVLAVDGRVHDQSAPRGGKRRAKTLPIAPKAGSSAVCWSRPRASRSAWPSKGPTATT